MTGTSGSLLPLSPASVHTTSWWAQPGMLRDATWLGFALVMDTKSGCLLYPVQGIQGGPCSWTPNLGTDVLLGVVPGLGSPFTLKSLPHSSFGLTSSQGGLASAPRERAASGILRGGPAFCRPWRLCSRFASYFASLAICSLPVISSLLSP